MTNLLAWRFAIAIISVVAFVSSANATKDLVLMEAELQGGSVNYFLNKIEGARKHQERIVIPKDKECASSCTLLSDLIKDGLLCAQPGAVLVFHKFFRAPNMKVSRGIIVSPGDKIIPLRGYSRWKIWIRYPPHIQKAIVNASGGRGLPTPKFDKAGKDTNALRIPAKGLVPPC